MHATVDHTYLGTRADNLYNRHWKPLNSKEELKQELSEVLRDWIKGSH